MTSGIDVVASRVPAAVLGGAAGAAVAHAERLGRNPLGMVDVFHDQWQWQLRQDPGIYEAFVDAVGCEELWVSIDRYGVKPTTVEDGRATFLHWDIEPDWAPDARRRGLRAVQGMLCLRDVPVDAGPFWCAPELNDVDARDAHLAQWPLVASPGGPLITGIDPTPVPARAGDLIIWDYHLAHGQAPNRSSEDRVVFYVSMRPAGSEAERRARIDDLAARRAPRWAHRHDVANEPGGELEWTPLGRRLAGLDRW